MLARFIFPTAFQISYQIASGLCNGYDIYLTEECPWGGISHMHSSQSRLLLWNMESVHLLPLEFLQTKKRKRALRNNFHFSCFDSCPKNVTTLSTKIIGISLILILIGLSNVLREQIISSRKDVSQCGVESDVRCQTASSELRARCLHLALTLNV